MATLARPFIGYRHRFSALAAELSGIHVTALTCPAALGTCPRCLSCRHCACRLHLSCLCRAALLHSCIRLHVCRCLHRAESGQRLVHGIHSHADSHKACHGTVRIASGVTHTLRNILDRHTTHDIEIASKHCAFIAHVDELLGLFVIGNARDTDLLDLHTAHLVPIGIQNVLHVLAQLHRLGSHIGNTCSVRRHLVDCRLQRL